MSGYNFTYKAEVAKSTKKDAITAMCFFVYLFIVMYALGTVLRVFAIQGIEAQAVGILFKAVGIAPCLVIVLIKRQGLSSIGIRKENLWPALRLGLLFSAFVLMLNRGLLPGLIQGWQFQRIDIILYLLLYAVIMAAFEDIIFTGYIQTRLYGT